MRNALLSLAIAVGLTGCPLDPEDPLFIFGTLPDAVGDPSHGTVELWRSTSIVPHLVGVEDPELEFERFATYQAEADGFWSGELTYFDTVLLYEGRMQDRSWKAIYAPRSDLPPVVATFAFEGADMDLPPLVQWDPSYVVTETADSLHVRLSPAPRFELHENLLVRQSERTDAYGLQFYGPDGQHIWFVPSSPEGAEFELPLVALEDFATESGLVAHTRGPWIAPDAGLASFSASYSEVSQIFPKTPFAPAAGPRISLLRGQPCMEADIYEGVPYPRDPCPATDGQIAAASTEGGLAPFSSLYEFPLPAAAPLSWVVVRDLQLVMLKNARVELRGAADGQWHHVGDIAGAVVEPAPLGNFGSVPFPEVLTTQLIEVPAGLPAADALRISLGEPITEQELTEAGVPPGSFNVPPNLGRLVELSVF